MCTHEHRNIAMCMCVCVHVCSKECVCANLFKCIWVCAYASLYVYWSVSMGIENLTPHSCAQVRGYVSVHTCVSVNVSVRTFTDVRLGKTCTHVYKKLSGYNSKFKITLSLFVLVNANVRYDMPVHSVRCSASVEAVNTSHECEPQRDGHIWRPTRFSSAAWLLDTAKWADMHLCSRRTANPIRIFLTFHSSNIRAPLFVIGLCSSP